MIRSERGFTLLSMMVALGVLCIVCTLIASFATATFGNQSAHLQDRKDIWLFFQQIDRQLATGSAIVVGDKQITFNENDDKIDYKLMGTNVRRRVDGAGYEIVLKKVKHLAFQYTPGLIQIDVVDVKGRSYRWSVLNMLN